MIGITGTTQNVFLNTKQYFNPQSQPGFKVIVKLPIQDEV